MCGQKIKKGNQIFVVVENSLNKETLKPKYFKKYSGKADS